MKVQIDPALFDQIEAYLQARAAQQDGEAARLLMALEDAEIERTAAFCQALEGANEANYSPSDLGL